MIYLLSALLAALEPFVILGPGYISTAGPGLLERVAERRAANDWGLSGDWTAYDALVATADCRNLGKRGWLIANGNVHSTIVVDCQADVHAGIMESRGLLLDTNRRELVHLKGWLVLKPPQGGTRRLPPRGCAPLKGVPGEKRL